MQVLVIQVSISEGGLDHMTYSMTFQNDELSAYYHSPERQGLQNYKKMLLHIVYIYKMILPRFKTFNRVKNQFCTFRSS